MDKENKRDHYPLEMITEENSILIDKNGNKSINKEGPLDSMEEWYFFCYLKELQEAGVIIGAYKSEIPIELSQNVHHVYTKKMKTKDKVSTKNILGGHIYTPDFYIEWNPKWLNLFYDRYNEGIQKDGHKIPFITTPGNTDCSLIEIKGSFVPESQSRAVSINIKWAFDKHRIYVQKVKIPDIFKGTFTPKEYVKDQVYKRSNSKKKIKAGDSKIDFEVVSIDQYLEKIKIIGSFQQKII